MSVHLLASCVGAQAQTYCGVSSAKASLGWTLRDNQTNCPDCLFVLAAPRFIESYRAFQAKPPTCPLA